MRRLCAIIMTLCLGVLPGIAPGSASENRSTELSLLAFNVGKADSLLLRCGASAYLIDVGRGKNADDIEKYLAALGIKHLDGVIITHMDSDHVGGLKKLLKTKLQVEHVYIPPFYYQENGKKETSPAVKTAEKEGLEAEILRSGDELPLDGGILRVLGPVRAATDKEDNNSLVLYAEAGGGSMLLAGDMEFPEEADLLKAGLIPRADVLKVGNHGDDDATSSAFLSAVQPRIAVISTSTAEKESTPARRTLRELAAWKTEVYQTQEAKAGILVTIRDGEVRAERLDKLN